MERPPLTSPAPWMVLLEDKEPTPSGGPSPANELSIPGKGWPKIETIDYVSKLIVLIVMLLALPWLVDKLLNNPSEVMGHSAGVAMGPASMGA